jgi:hypothetical protein
MTAADPRRLSRIALLLALASLALAGTTRAQDTGPAGALASVAPPQFYFKSYMGRCLDFGPPPQIPGTPVFIFDCNGTVAQQVGVEEISSLGAHQVLLRAGNLCIGTNSTSPLAGTALFLQICGTLGGQLFALDGDSILLDSNLDLAVQLKDGVTKSRTPLVVGARQVSDTELWDMEATDGSARRPTSGFIAVSTDGDPVLQAEALRQALVTAGRGTVIEIPPGEISFHDLAEPLPVSERVTIRGDRRGVLLGPQISLSSGPDESSLFVTTGDHARITGLRLRGPGRDRTEPSLKGVNGDGSVSALIDHNDVSDWTTSDIDLFGHPFMEPLECPAPLPVRSQIVRVFRNYIHDSPHGYGVVSGSGSNPLIFGNTFQKTHHSVSSDGFALSAYSAVSNLFMPANEDTDVDVHGELPTPNDTDDFGGIGGLGAEVLNNTFLGTGRTNFGVRGTPCSGALDTFYGNVAVKDIAGAITVVPDGKKGKDGKSSGSSVAWTSVRTQTPFLRVNSQFSIPNPTQAFLVGDFDGDGKDDLFMTTGAGWYYSSAANAEWRFLSAKTETIGSLLLGDFDGDGRVDVFTQIGDKWMVSWGGRSDWQLLSEDHGGAVNHAIRGMLDFVIGDFVGDKRADVFYADGTNWWASDGGTGPFTFYATSSYKLPDILFGDFDADGKTDVAGVVANRWMFVPANGPHQWTPLGRKLTDTMAGLIAADFDGNGKTDIAEFEASLLVSMRVSRDGARDWELLNRGVPASSIVAIGRFDDVPGADILIWNGSYLEALSGGSGVATRQSRQDMR